MRKRKREFPLEPAPLMALAGQTNMSLPMKSGPLFNFWFSKLTVNLTIELI